VKRIARGGKVLAPGPRDNPFQSITCATLRISLAGLRRAPVVACFISRGRCRRIVFEDFLTMVVAEVGPPECELMWIDAQELLENGCPGRNFPCGGTRRRPHVLELDSSRANRSGIATATTE